MVSKVTCYYTCTCIVVKKKSIVLYAPLKYIAQIEKLQHMESS